MQKYIIYEDKNKRYRKKDEKWLKPLQEYTHTHTQGNLINEKITSIKMLLFAIYKTDQLI